MLIQRHTRILAIDPGTSEMGFAVLEDGALRGHGVKVIRRGRSPKETLDRARSEVAELIEDFRPGVLVIEKTFIGQNRNAALLNVLGDEIKSLGLRNKVKVLCFAPSTVRKVVCGSGRADKGDVARVVAARYPELKAFLFKDRKWKELFHANMFDAVALGMAASH
jgi:crossover junction endodeoxyribonuclease RuvC